MAATLKRDWRPLIMTLPIAGILVAGSLGVYGWHQSNQLDTAYQYRFEPSTPGTATKILEQEIAFYQERIRHDPDDGLNRASLAGTYLQMARATGDANWYLLAEQSAKRSLANLPFDNQGAIIVLARIAEAKHDFSEAIRLSQQILNVEPGNEEALSIQVTSKLATGKLDEANRQANLLVEQIPSIGTLTLRALVRAAQGQDAAAIADFQQALAEEEAGEAGSSARTRTLLGRFYFQRGNPTLAKKLHQEALRIIPRYPLALINLAALETRLGDYRAAERYYSQVYVSPAYPNVYDHVALQGRARIEQLQGNTSEAEKLWENAETLLRQHQSLTSFGHQRELARLLLERGHTKDLPEALRLMQAEVRLRRDAETLDTMAWVLSRLERWSEAQKVLQEAIARGTRDAGIFYRAGIVEQALGNRPQAIAYFQLAQETDPTFDKKAQQLLGLDSNPETEVK